jgi:hypothetical protein
MLTRDKIITASFFAIALLLAFVGIITYNFERGVRNGELLDEERLKETALWYARQYGLESEPEILVAEYRGALGTVVSNPKPKPDYYIYVVTLKGKFDQEKSKPLVPLWREPDPPKPVESVTVTVNAHTGLLRGIVSEDISNLDLTTTSSN